jgi:hypothetical protein
MAFRHAQAPDPQGSLSLVVQSIMGATDTLRSIFPREKSSERPIFPGSLDSGVSAGFLGIPGSSSFAEGT